MQRARPQRKCCDGPITLVGADEFLPYDRPNLAKDYLAGTAPEEWIPLRSADFYGEQKIDTILNTSAVAVDPKTKQVTLSDGRSLGYGALLLATGAQPVRLSIPGDDLPHVCYLRTLSDSRRYDLLTVLPQSVAMAALPRLPNRSGKHCFAITITSSSET